MGYFATEKLSGGKEPVFVSTTDTYAVQGRIVDVPSDSVIESIVIDGYERISAVDSGLPYNLTGVTLPAGVSFTVGDEHTIESIKLTSGFIIVYKGR